MRDNPFKIRQGSVRDRNLSSYNASRHEGDNLLFMPDFSGWLGKNLKSKHLLFFYLFLGILFSLLLLRIFYLQCWVFEVFVDRSL